MATIKPSRRTIARIIATKLLVDGADRVAIMQALAAYLVQNNMTDAADVIINDIANELFLQSGLLTVEVTSARALTDEARSNLEDFLKRSTDAQTIQLHESIDEDLIGGLIAKTPAAEVDMSIRRTLRQLTAIV